MPKPPVTKPRSFPSLGHNGGSWGWDPDRRQVTLRFMVAGHGRKIVRADTTTGCLTKRDEMRAAAAAEAAEEAELLHGQGTVAQLLEAWFAYHAGSRKQATRMTYRRSLRIVGEHPLGKRRAHEVTIGDIERFYLWMVDERDLGHGQLVMTRTHLRMAFTHGVRHGYTRANPVLGSKLPGHTRPPGQVTWLFDDQFDAMRQYLREHTTTINTALLTGLLTGLRPGETIALCWDDVDFDTGLIHVRRALKTPQSERKVEMTPDLIVALRRERRAQRVRQLAATRWLDSDLVFNRQDGRALIHDQLRYRLHQACKTIGIEPLSPHKLRHTNGSVLLDRGAPMADVAKHLGHKDMRMMTTTYGHSVKAQVPVAALLAETV
jgi:integrase